MVDILSSFSMSTLSFCFDGVNWSLWLDGCAIVVWIRVDDGQIILKNSSSNIVGIHKHHSKGK